LDKKKDKDIPTNYPCPQASFDWLKLLECRRKKLQDISGIAVNWNNLMKN
jgi:hypothetical protein